MLVWYIPSSVNLRLSQIWIIFHGIYGHVGSANPFLICWLCECVFFILLSSSNRKYIQGLRNIYKGLRNCFVSMLVVSAYSLNKSIPNTTLAHSMKCKSCLDLFLYRTKKLQHFINLVGRNTVNFATNLIFSDLILWMDHESCTCFLFWTTIWLKWI